MNIEAQLIALLDGSTLRFFIVQAPSSISFFTVGMSALGIEYAPQPSRPIRITCSGVSAAAQSVTAAASAVKICRNFMICEYND